VQFIAVQEEVEELIRQGYGYKMIHEKLAEEGRITMSYDTFYNYLRRNKKTKQSQIDKTEKKTNTAPSTTKGPVWAEAKQEKSFSEMVNLTQEEKEKLF
jgi:hypothetical protein